MRYLLLLLFPTLCFGQGFSQTAAFQGAAVIKIAASVVASPLDQVTNQAGYPALVFYLPSNTTYTTNGSVVTLANSGVGGTAWDLTNNAATSKWPVSQSSALNSKDTLLWNGTSTWLKNAAATNAQPFTIMAVMRWNDVTNSGSRYFWTTPAGSIVGWHSGGSNRLTMGSLFIAGSIIRTNRWQVWTYHLNGTGSLLQTNNVDDGSSANNFKSGLSGFVLGSSAALSALFSPIDLAALVIYTNSTATVRSNAYWGLTNYFNLTP